MVLPHGNFKQLAPQLWILEGSLPHHNPLPRSMTVFRLKNGDLWIHSPIALDNERKEKLLSFGKPTYIVVPNQMHRLDAGAYALDFPSALVVCPEADIKKVEESVEVSMSCEEAFKNHPEIRAHLPPGVKPTELVYELTLETGEKALVFNDLIVNQSELPGVKGWLLSKLGRIGQFRTPPMQKLIFLTDRRLFKDWILKLAKRSDIGIVTLSHGQPEIGNIPSLLKRVANLM